MKRLIATIGADVRLQFRNGFYYATAFVLAVWILLFAQLQSGTNGLNLSWLLPVFILDSMIINSFFFISGLVLLEKDEGTLQAQVVTPLRTWEYLASKVITLTLLALAQYVVIVALFYNPGLGFVPLIAGIALASTLYVLLGFVSVARYSSINEYLLPSALYAGALILPLGAYVMGWDNLLVYLHPLEAPLMLMKAAFQPVEAWQLVYGVLYSGLWVGLAFRFSLRSFHRFVIAGQGAS
jgi:fluoroquinolone transport system permease protein